MKNNKSVQQFFFVKANYHVGDGKYNSALLKIDYQNNKYFVKPLRAGISPNFSSEVGNIAKDLLKRKHGINFADKL